MSEQVVDINRVGKVYGDRVLVQRMAEPEKKRGLYVPASHAMKKEPRKVWWAKLMLIGKDSKAGEDLELNIGDLIGIEPLGHHYASFRGTDGNFYCWVPDEHLCLADEGSYEEYHLDRLDRNAAPQVRVLGERLLLRPVKDEEITKSKIHRIEADHERDAKVGDIVDLGRFDKESDPGVCVGNRVVHVAEENGSSCIVDLFDPNLVILRAADLIATIGVDREEQRKKEEAENLTKKEKAMGIPTKKKAAA